METVTTEETEKKHILKKSEQQYIVEALYPFVYNVCSRLQSLCSSMC